MSNSRGLWLSSFQQGLDAAKPTVYPGDGNIAIWFATDTGIIYVSASPATPGGNATWVAALPANADVVYNATAHTLVLANMPTADPHVVGGLWSSSGTVHLSAG